MTTDFGMSNDGFKIKRVPEIKQDLEAAARIALGSDATLLPDSIEGVIIEIFSEIFAQQWEQLHAAYGAFNPLLVTGQALDNLAILTGIERLAPLPSRAFLDISGVDGSVIPAGSIIKHSISGAEFLTENAVEIGVNFPIGTAQVFASARVNGEIEAIAGSLIIIDTPVNGWDSVINNTDAAIGRLAETDGELRGRRERSLSLSGQSSLASIISSVQGVSNVTFAGAVENVFDSIDVNGLPPHSFQAVVEGGTDEAVAQAIWEKKPAGIEAFGDVTVDVNDIFGNTHSVSFSRPIQVPIYINATVTFLSKVPDNAAQVLTDALLLFVSGGLVSGQNIGVGDDIINSRLYMPFNIAFPETTISVLEMSIDGVTFSPADITINFNQIGLFDASRIVIQVG